MKTIERLRKELGGIHPLAANKVRSSLEPSTQAFIENASFAVMASATVTQGGKDWNAKNVLLAL